MNAKITKKDGSEFYGWLVNRSKRFELLIGKSSIDEDYDGIVVVEEGDKIEILSQ